MTLCNCQGWALRGLQFLPLCARHVSSWNPDYAMKSSSHVGKLNGGELRCSGQQSQVSFQPTARTNCQPCWWGSLKSPPTSPGGEGPRWLQLHPTPHSAEKPSSWAWSTLRIVKDNKLLLLWVIKFWCGFVIQQEITETNPGSELGRWNLLESETNSKYFSALGIPKWDRNKTFCFSGNSQEKQSLVGSGRINKNNAVKWYKLCFVSSVTGKVYKHYCAIKVSNLITTICMKQNNQLSVWWEEYIKSVAINSRGINKVYENGISFVWMWGTNAHHVLFLRNEKRALCGLRPHSE